MAPALAFALALMAFGAFAAEPATKDPVVAPVATQEMKPGYGRVERITEVRVKRERSAAAGGSAQSSDQDAEARPAYRVAVRMADGSLQHRDLAKPEFKVGDNVLLTNAGDIVPD
ncbi:MAG TPA: hypothetical protein VFK84_05210 [Burkholderiales bacterium]|nr:hypothetical protein [Burkholderiales bacterium]